MVMFSLQYCYKISCHIVMMLVSVTSTNMNFPLQKASAAQIYSYNFQNLNPNQSLYYDTSLATKENKCLNGLINRMPQNGDRETTEACFNTFGYNPQKNIKSPVMIIFEVGTTSQEVVTTVIYKSKNSQINHELFYAVGARYYEWHPPAGIYTLDYIKRDNSSSFKPAYGNFYSPKGQKDKNGNPVNFGFHGREGSLMSGNGSNGCYRHHVPDMKRIMAIIKNTGKGANLPSNWFEETLPIVVLTQNITNNLRR
jgi:hypothetical protein